jgi:hypothetical protein
VPSRPSYTSRRDAPSMRMNLGRFNARYNARFNRPVRGPGNVRPGGRPGQFRPYNGQSLGRSGAYGRGGSYGRGGAVRPPSRTQIIHQRATTRAPRPSSNPRKLTTPQQVRAAARSRWDAVHNPSTSHNLGTLRIGVQEPGRYEPDEIGLDAGQPQQAQAHLDDTCAGGGHALADGTRTSQAWWCGDGPDASEGVFNQSKKSSRRLGRNLEEAGWQRPPSTAAHHIVAGDAHGARPAHDVLTQFRIDINAAENGVFLPRDKDAPNPSGAAVHASLHTGPYYRAVNSALGQATNREEAIAILDRIRKRLLSGGYP